MPERKCIGCGDEIEESMGAVLARDVLSRIQGKPVRTLREICGRCEVLRSVGLVSIKELVKGA